MRRVFRFILLKPVLWAAAKFSSRPEKERIFQALTALYQAIQFHPGKKGPVIPFELETGKFIIFSDQHKGTRNGADDFKGAEENYLAALTWYNEEGYTFINLGDSEELWENRLWKVKKKNKATFQAEKKFIERDKYIKVFGNHDLYWNMSPFASFELKNIYGTAVPIYEGVVLKTSFTETSTYGDGQQIPIQKKSPLTLFLTHGHQGDAQSDGNWFSKFFVAVIWAPFQSLLRINPNTPAYDAEKKTLHNDIMYEWSSAQNNMLLITGHTHQPVFCSLTLLEELYKKLQVAQQRKEEEVIAGLKREIQKREKEFAAVSIDYMTMKPSYFNTGCCCFSDGDITGIEISEGFIRLIKWANKKNNPQRIILNESKLGELINFL